MKVFSNGSALVQEFHETYGQPIRSERILDVPEREMRMGLIAEEFDELMVAQRADDFIEVVDAWADMVYVIYGAGKTHGVDIDAFIRNLDLPDPSVSDSRRTLSEVPNLFINDRLEVMNDIAASFYGLEQAYAHNNLDAMELRWALLTYTVYEAAYRHGVDLNKVLLEVQRSNLSKLGTDENGEKIVLRREDGKILKGPDFSQPDIVTALVEQGYEA